MADETKSFHTFDELVELLASRGVLVDDRTRPVLMCESYYAVVNGYKDLFLDPKATREAGDDRYLPGTRFAELHALYQLDRSLRTLFLPYLLLAETTLKTLTVHAFCDDFRERDAYLHAGNFDLRSQRGAVVAQLIESLTRAVSTESDRHPKDFIEHYLSKHEFVPLWVLANFLTFGTMSKFYSCMRESTQSKTCRLFGAYMEEAHDAAIRVEPHEIQLAFRVLADFRNICAHDERLYCARLGKVGDQRVKQMFQRLASVLPADALARMRGESGRLLESTAPAFETISLDAVVRSMGFESLEDVYRGA